MGEWGPAHLSPLLSCAVSDMAPWEEVLVRRHSPWEEALVATPRRDLRDAAEKGRKLADPGSYKRVETESLTAAETVGARRRRALLG